VPDIPTSQENLLAEAVKFEEFAFQNELEIKGHS
jgi:hypothetical protein